MEFNEKLQELRKAKGITQEELAQALYVSRIAVSKWESGRGYPSIDSLKEISGFFSVTIDELICSEEIMAAAKEDKESSLHKLIALICSLLDVFMGLLLFIPVFGNGAGSPSAVSLLSLTGTQLWIRYLFFGLIMVTLLNGIAGVVLSSMDKPAWGRQSIAVGMILEALCSAVFILTRQPYAGIICFSVLIVKGFLLIGKRQ
ncbi:MAG: helix-turn-helix transcriptional regulator [Eubacteriales bacterium]|nr:helix-turn-helix transcriptional regulator [Eubacteriales bacterium]